jgi:hypothetical protein
MFWFPQPQKHHLFFSEKTIVPEKTSRFSTALTFFWGKMGYNLFCLKKKKKKNYMPNSRSLFFRKLKNALKRLFVYQPSKTTHFYLVTLKPTNFLPQGSNVGIHKRKNFTFFNYLKMKIPHDNY